MIKYFLCLCILHSLQATGQINDTAVTMVHYVFNSFTPGHVMLKSGEVSIQVLNYNVITREMIFEQGGVYLAIARPEDVDTVFINGRKFIPVSGAFYEYLGGSVYPLFVEYNCTIREKGASTGFGATNTTAAVAIKSLQNEAGAYKLKLPDQFEVTPRQAYYIQMAGKYYKVKNEQQMLKLFPEKKQVIKEWIRNNHTNFSRQDDLLSLVNQIQ